jgi:hypothetical protein
MDKYVVLRSVVGAVDRHEPYQCHTGWTRDNLASLGGRPCLGAAVARLRGPVDRAVPPFVGLANVGVWKDPGQAGFLGPTYGPFQPDGLGMQNMKLNGVTLERLGDRKQLRTSFDAFQRVVDAEEKAKALDSFTQRAFDVLTSSRLLQALDLSKEDPKVRARYGDGKPFNFQYDGAPTDNEHLLIARRLVEAGVRCVTLTYGRWDSHGEDGGVVNSRALTTGSAQSESLRVWAANGRAAGRRRFVGPDGDNQRVCTVPLSSQESAGSGEKNETPREYSRGVPSTRGSASSPFFQLAP